MDPDYRVLLEAQHEEFEAHLEEFGLDGLDNMIPEHVRVLREGDDASKTAAAEALGYLTSGDYQQIRVFIGEVGAIPLLVQLLRDGSAEAKLAAASALGNLSFQANEVLIAEAGVIPLLVEFARDGGAKAKFTGANALRDIATNDDNAVLIAATVGFDGIAELARYGWVTLEGDEPIVEDAGPAAQREAARLLPGMQVLIAEAGGIARFVEILRDASAEDFVKARAALALWGLAFDNDANAVAIAVAFGFGAVVELARGGGCASTTTMMSGNASPAAKRGAPPAPQCAPRARAS
ncbi:hypothetical protein JL720_5566 [Aureococcus anophagefferens]|nr:hypothetical protein JL720_5566 [Aureococcus anophagefferens]